MSVDVLVLVLRAVGRHFCSGFNIGAMDGRFDVEAFRRDVARADASEDLREGARAWMEKRAPRFRGQ